MISINKLPQAKKNLEQDLKRIYDSVCKTLSEEVSDILSGNFGLPFELPKLVSMTEDELMDFLIEKENPELSEDERKEFKEEVKEKISKKGWKSFCRFLSILNRYRRYISPLPRVQAAWLTLSYDMIVHPILFSNWHWKDFDGFGLDQFSITLSPKEVYDGLRNCNPDMVSVCINNLEHCSIADKEILQEAFDNDQRVVFIDKLKTLSPSDYYCLGLITSWFHYEKALLSFDWETLKILFYHMDFGDEVGIDLSGLPNVDCMDLIAEFDENDPSEDNYIAFCDAFCETLEPLVNLLISNVYSYLKYRLPRVIESIKPFPFEKKYLDDVLSIPEVKSILDELPENPDERNMAPDDQEQPENQPLIVQPIDQKPEDDGKPDDTEYVPHWPTDEELKGYDDIDEDSRFFTNTIFGSPGNVKASDVDKLLNVLIPLNIIKDELETKLTFLARYSGKSIPHLELKRIEWKMLDSTNRERALGYLIMKTAGAQYAKGADFFYYEINGKRALPDKREMGYGAHALNNPDRRDTTKIEFEHRFNAFLNEYLSSKKG